MDNQREKEIQLLCYGVINATPLSWYNGNGADESECPFCHEVVYYAGARIDQIKHDLNCAYLIAKSLSTNLKGGK